MGAVRGYKVNSELEQWNDASTCWCKEKSSAVKCGEGTLLGWFAPQFNVTRLAICLRDVELITSALSSVSAIFHEEDGRKDF